MLIKKFGSRKFLACIIGVLTGAATVFGLDESAISTISGAVISISSVVAYISAEGRIDAAAAGKAAQDIQEALDAVMKGDKREGKRTD